jgi:hypothetical protein
MAGEKAHDPSDFVRGFMQGRYRASAYWPELYDLTLAKNPRLKPVLTGFGPDMLG